MSKGQNLTMRMQIRRLTRLTNAFSKKWENLKAALALYFARSRGRQAEAALSAKERWAAAKRKGMTTLAS